MYLRLANGQPLPYTFCAKTNPGNTLISLPNFQLQYIKLYELLNLSLSAGNMPAIFMGKIATFYDLATRRV